MALNPIVFTEKVVRSFLRYQLTAYPFADARLLSQMRRLLLLDETRQLPLLKGPYVSLARRKTAGFWGLPRFAPGIVHRPVRYYRGEMPGGDCRRHVGMLRWPFKWLSLRNQP